MNFFDQIVKTATRFWHAARPEPTTPLDQMGEGLVRAPILTGEHQYLRVTEMLMYPLLKLALRHRKGSHPSIGASGAPPDRYPERKWS